LRQPAESVDGHEVGRRAGRCARRPSDVYTSPCPPRIWSESKST
jgi:hypothetical protein